MSENLLKLVGVKKSSVDPRCNNCASWSSRNARPRQERSADLCHGTVLRYLERMDPLDEHYAVIKEEARGGGCEQSV